MRNMLILIVLLPLSCTCNHHDIKVIHSDASVPGVTQGVPWTEILYHVTIPRYHYGADKEMTDIVPGLRLSENRILTEIANVHAPRKDELVVRNLKDDAPIKATVIRQYLENFTVLKTEAPMTGPNPVFAQHYPKVGDDVRVGPHTARVFSVSLHGERYRRFTLVFRRYATERTDFPTPCAVGMPVMDADDSLLGVTMGYMSDVEMPPIGFDHTHCKVLSSSELLDLLKWVD